MSDVSVRALLDACTEFPCPWRTIEGPSGVLVKDAKGTTILLCQFTGQGTRGRKRRVAQLLVQMINHAHTSQV